MSISVDDLVSSFATSHIGQEAHDLATLQVSLLIAFFLRPIHYLLQAQLAQALFNLSGSEQRPLHSHIEPCNTPTRRTPSSSFSWGRSPFSRQGRDVDLNDDMDDEAMVEDILMPSPSPVATSSIFSHQQQQPQSQQWPISQKTFASAKPTSSSFQSEASVFTTTDPFYNAQLQALQKNMVPTSFLSGGLPSQQSPFMKQTQNSHGFMSDSPGSPMECHSFLVATSAAFDR